MMVNFFKILKAKYFALLMRNSWICKYVLFKNLKVAVNMVWYRRYLRYFPWNNPTTLNEKITWLSAMTDTSKWTEYSDKFEVRKYIQSIGLGHILTECYGVWNSVEEIDFDKLPCSFVLKCTHDCGSTILVEDKNKLNISETKSFLKKHLKYKMGYDTCEPHYTKIKPRIMAEELLKEKSVEGFSSHSAVDYKFWCINGKVEWLFICYDRYLESESTHSAVFDIYDVRSWKPMRQYLTSDYKKVNFKDVPKPENLEEMVITAEKIASGFKQVRVDLYDINNKIYFGEMTFTSQGGRMSYYTQEFQERMGGLIDLKK